MSCDFIVFVVNQLRLIEWGTAWSLARAMAVMQQAMPYIRMAGAAWGVIGILTLIGRKIKPMIVDGEYKKIPSYLREIDVKKTAHQITNNTASFGYSVITFSMAATDIGLMSVGAGNGPVLTQCSTALSAIVTVTTPGRSQKRDYVDLAVKGLAVLGALILIASFIDSRIGGGHLPSQLALLGTLLTVLPTIKAIVDMIKENKEAARKSLESGSELITKALTTKWEEGMEIIEDWGKHLKQLLLNTSVNYSIRVVAGIPTFHFHED